MEMETRRLQPRIVVNRSRIVAELAIRGGRAAAPPAAADRPRGSERSLITSVSGERSLIGSVSGERPLLTSRSGERSLITSVSGERSLITSSRYSVRRSYFGLAISAH
jgi:hypothetical protein